MERLTNQDHKKSGFYAYVGEKNPYETPLTVGEIAAFSTERDGFSPQQILREMLERLAAYEDTGWTPEDIKVMHNELCLQCGRYKEAHLGACNGCRWRKEV